MIHDCALASRHWTIATTDTDKASDMNDIDFDLDADIPIVRAEQPRHIESS